MSMSKDTVQCRTAGLPTHEGSTLPVAPSTVTRIPVRSRAVASPQPTTAGIPYSRAMIEACAAALPTSVTTAAARVKSGVQAGAVSGATRISPGWSSSNSCGPADHADQPARATRRRWRAGDQGAFRWNRADEPREGVPQPAQDPVQPADEQRRARVGPAPRAATVGSGTSTVAGRGRRRRAPPATSARVRKKTSSALVDHAPRDERLADAQHRPAHDRPRDRQLGRLLLPDRDEVLGLGEQAAEGSRPARRRGQGLNAAASAACRASTRRAWSAAGRRRPTAMDGSGGVPPVQRRDGVAGQDHAGGSKPARRGRWLPPSDLPRWRR